MIFEKNLRRTKTRRKVIVYPLLYNHFEQYCGKIIYLYHAGRFIAVTPLLTAIEADFCTVIQKQFYLFRF